MGMRFEFATATKIIFGVGVLSEVAPAVREMGTRAFVVTGRTPGRAEKLIAMLRGIGVEVSVFSVSGEPTVSLVMEGARASRQSGCDVVIGIGGGSAIDAGKAIAALATNRGAALDYLEVIGRGQPLEVSPLPFVAIPTTAGTGAEVTRNAVLASPEHQVKVSMRSPLMLPRLAVVDPELSLGLPAGLTASTGMDALTQLIESFLSCRSNPMTDAFCRQGIPLAARSLRRACEEPGNLAAREDMSLASLLSGLALANSGLGVVHGFAASIGGMSNAAHGAICAALLPHALVVNLRAVRARRGDDPVVRRFDELAGLLTGGLSARADDALRWLATLGEGLKVSRLATLGVEESFVPEICVKAAQSSSMKGNPVALLPEELREIVSAAW